MQNSLHEIELRDLRKFFPSATGDDLSGDFFISEIQWEDVPETMHILENPCRLNGYMAIFCLSGHMKVEVNLKTYDIRENSVIINVPGNIGRVYGSGTDRMDNLHFIVVAVSSDFLSSSRMDYIRMFDESIAILDNPCFTMSEDEKDIFGKYFELTRGLVGSGIADVREALRGIVSSCLYYAGAVWQSKLSAGSRGEDDANKPKTMRPKLILEQFLKLVAEYHDRERGMNFYAGKLCLTPKYLSKIVRDASGKSGPEWIDSFVILEAKNMLKYSDMPIKEIVYKLNFPNSSVFYKYFKAHTGQTPSEYRR